MGKRKKIEKQLAVYKKMQKGFLHILLIVLVCFGMVQMGELQEVQAARSDLMTLEGEKDVVVILKFLSRILPGRCMQKRVILRRYKKGRGQFIIICEMHREALGT